MYNGVVDLFDEFDKIVCICIIEIDILLKLRYLYVKFSIMLEIG